MTTIVQLAKSRAVLFALLLLATSSSFAAPTPEEVAAAKQTFAICKT